MTIEYADPFEGYTVLTDLYTLLGTGTGSGTGAITAGVGRGGSSGYQTTNANSGIQRALTAGATKWIHGACKLAIPGSTQKIFELLDGSTSHLDLRYDTSGKLLITRNGTTIAGPSALSLNPSNHEWIEFGGTIADSGGTAEVWVNGVQWLTFTGDTRNAGNASANFVAIFQTTSNSNRTWILDDLIVADTRVGDTRAMLLAPDGNGGSSQFTGSDGNSTDNYLLVDDAAPNSDTDYVESSTVGHKDLYTYGNTGLASGTVAGLVVLTTGKKSDAGARTYRAIVKLSGTTSNGATVNPSTGYATTVDVLETKPGGGSWALADVDAVEAGVEVVS